MEFEHGEDLDGPFCDPVHDAVVAFGGREVVEYAVLAGLVGPHGNLEIDDDASRAPAFLMIFYTARYLVSADTPPLEGGVLLDVGGRVAAVGTLTDLQHQAPDAEVIDFGDALIVPTVVNAHTHLELTDYPLWAAEAGQGGDPSSFVDWLLRLIRVKRGLDPSGFSRSVVHGVLQSLVAGTGAVGDVLSHYPARDAYRGGSLQGVAHLETLGLEPARIVMAEKLLDETLAEPWDEALSIGVSPHSPYTLGAGYLERVYQRCRDRSLRCTTHLAESPEEVELLGTGRGDLARRFYPKVGWAPFVPVAVRRRPAQVIEECGGLFPGNLLVHGVQLNDPEIVLLARRRMHLALCPRSNARLEVGRAPVEALSKAGVLLALGTDSLASNDTLSIWDEMAFAHTWFDGALDPPTLFRMATLGGAEALGLAGELGSLSVGKQTGFVVLRPKTIPRSGELFDYLVAPGRTEEIEQVFVGGKRVWRRQEGETEGSIILSGSV